MSESHCNRINPLGVKLNMPTKHAKQTSQDFLKLAGNLHMTEMTGEQTCQTINGARNQNM